MGYAYRVFIAIHFFIFILEMSKSLKCVYLDGFRDGSSGRKEAIYYRLHEDIEVQQAYLDGYLKGKSLSSTHQDINIEIKK